MKKPPKWKSQLESFYGFLYRNLLLFCISVIICRMSYRAKPLDSISNHYTHKTHKELLSKGFFLYVNTLIRLRAMKRRLCMPKFPPKQA